MQFIAGAAGFLQVQGTVFRVGVVHLLNGTDADHRRCLAVIRAFQRLLQGTLTIVRDQHGQ